MLTKLRYKVSCLILALVLTLAGFGRVVHMCLGSQELAWLDAVAGHCHFDWFVLCSLATSLGTSLTQESSASLDVSHWTEAFFKVILVLIFDTSSDWSIILAEEVSWHIISWVAHSMVNLDWQVALVASLYVEITFALE